MNDLKLAGPEEMALGGRAAPSADTVLNRGFFGFWTTDSWRPSVNLYETPDAFVICADIAGMDKDRIDVRVDERQLTIRGRRNCPTPPGMARTVAVHLMEIDHGVFGRTVEVPANVDSEAIAAEYHQGLLWITLPKVG
ncbi:MAG: Hsp20/alpha crystallin family protein [Phycisphaerales bacterium]|nr:Hsp20/alpha crystallin family protein [Phycisphaerales bacterium]